MLYCKANINNRGLPLNFIRKEIFVILLASILVDPFCWSIPDLLACVNLNNFFDVIISKYATAICVVLTVCCAQLCQYKLQRHFVRLLGKILSTLHALLFVISTLIILFYLLFSLFYWPTAHGASRECNWTLHMLHLKKFILSAYLIHFPYKDKGFVEIWSIANTSIFLYLFLCAKDDD